MENVTKKETNLGKCHHSKLTLLVAERQGNLEIRVGRSLTDNDLCHYQAASLATDEYTHILCDSKLRGQFCPFATGTHLLWNLWGHSMGGG